MKLELGGSKISEVVYASLLSHLFQLFLRDLGTFPNQVRYIILPLFP